MSKSIVKKIVMITMMVSLPTKCSDVYIILAIAEELKTVKYVYLAEAASTIDRAKSL